MRWEVFQNVILANKSVSEKYEIDIYAIKNNKEIIIETKNKLGVIKEDMLLYLENLGIRQIYLK